MQLFARFFRPSGALFGTSVVGDKARRASDRPWTGRAHRSTGRCSAVTVPKRPMPTGSIASPNGWRSACREMRRLGARLPSCAIRSSDRSSTLRITADRTALSKERATAHPDRRGGRWAGIPAKPVSYTHLDVYKRQEKQRFYNNMYRALCSRNTWSDVNGEWVSTDGRVRCVADPANDAMLRCV